MSAARERAPRELYAQGHDRLRLQRHTAIEQTSKADVPRGVATLLDKLALLANERGEIFDYMARIAKFARYSRRWAQTLLRKAEELGQVEALRQPGQGPQGKHGKTLILLKRSWAPNRPALVLVLAKPAKTPPNPAQPGSDGLGGGKLQNQQTEVTADSGSASLSDPESSLQISVSPPIARATREGAEGGRTAPDGAPEESRPHPNPPRGGGRKPRNQSFEVAVSIVRAAPGDRQIREQSRARRHIGELCAALAASKLPMELLVTAAEQYARSQGPWGPGGWRTLKHGVQSIVSDVPRWTADLAARAERARPPPKRRATVALRAMISQIGTGSSAPLTSVAPKSTGAKPENVHAARPTAEEREARVARFVGRPPKREAEPEPLSAAPRPHPPTESPSPTAAPPELGAGFARMLAFLEQAKGKGK